MKVTVHVPVQFEVEPRATRNTEREACRIALIEAERLRDTMTVDPFVRPFVVAVEKPKVRNEK